MSTTNNICENFKDAPFGMVMPNRSWKAASADGYRFGFNGKEGDSEIKGEDNSLDFGARIYDPRSGRFLNLDPSAKQFPSNSPYAFAENKVIEGYDKEGKGFEQYFNGMTTANVSINYQWHKGFGVSAGLGFITGGNYAMNSRLASGITVGLSTQENLSVTMGLGVIFNMSQNNIGFPIVQNFYPSLNSIVNDYTTSTTIAAGFTVSENSGMHGGGQMGINFNMGENGAAGVSGGFETNFSKYTNNIVNYQSANIGVSYTVPSQIASPIFASPNATIPEPIGDRAISFNYDFNSTLQSGFENNFSLSASAGALQGLNMLNSSTTQYGGFNSIATTNPNYLPDFNFSSGFNYNFSVGYSVGKQETLPNGETVTPQGGLNVGGTISSTSYSEGD